MKGTVSHSKYSKKAQDQSFALVASEISAASVSSTLWTLLRSPSALAPPGRAAAAPLHLARADQTERIFQENSVRQKEPRARARAHLQLSSFIRPNESMKTDRHEHLSTG